MKQTLLIISILLFSIRSASAQQTQVADKITHYSTVLPTEKLYLNFDKPYYSVGDTLWFKSFLLNGNLLASTRSDKIHVELFNDSLKFIDSKVIALNNGLGYGDFALSKNLKEGSYVIRAYTNWQQNFGSDYFFQKSFYVGKAGENTWLLDAQQKLNNGKKKTLDLKIRITNIKNEPAGLKDLEIVLMNDKKRISKADLQTSLQGIMETEIPLGEEKINGNYSLIITDKKDKTKKAILPIGLQELDQLDLQFMPEGGHLVNGIFGRIAFKAIGADGLGKNISGIIVNGKNEKQAELEATHKGMGSFYLLPAKDDVYTAIYKLNGTEHRQILPLAKDEGTTLRVDHFSKTDSLYIYLKASEARRLDGYQLFAQAGGETILNANLNLNNGFATLKLPKRDFPDGIIHFSLFSPIENIVNERQVFINHKNKINLGIAPNRNSYAPMDSVSLELSATNEDGLPLMGSFSIAVTDNRQVNQIDEEGNIASYFLLQSDLKGNIENPSWYFNNENPSTLLALDNLLLTQGWVGYNWGKILENNPNPKFKAEKDNSIYGKVIGPFKKPLVGVKVNMLSLGNSLMITDTLTDYNGNFLFRNLELLDSAKYLLKIKNAKGKTANGDIVVEEFNKSIIPLKEFSLIKPWYVNIDSTKLNYFAKMQNKISLKEREEVVRTGTLLKEVEIKGQARLKEIIYKNAWDAKFLDEITEEDLKKVPQKKLIDLLKQKFPNFNIGDFWADGCGARPEKHSFATFRMGGSLLSHVLIDKVSTNLVASGVNDDYQQTGSSITGQQNEAKGITFGAAAFQTNNYIFNTLNASEITKITLYRGCVYYYLDITTRGGQGPWIAPTPGRYIYRPLPIYVAKEFYSPKYATKTTSAPDNRSTIFWDANVVTDENGKAKISFYAADKLSSYNIKIEGSDLMGRFGFKTENIKIINNTASK